MLNMEYLKAGVTQMGWNKMELLHTSSFGFKSSLSASLVTDDNTQMKIPHHTRSVIVQYIQILFMNT